jgi:hypothetical protein
VKRGKGKGKREKGKVVVFVLLGGFPTSLTVLKFQISDFRFQI